MFDLQSSKTESSTINYIHEVHLLKVEMTVNAPYFHQVYVNR